MKESGVTVPLSYFNLFEFGESVTWPLPPATTGCRGITTSADGTGGRGGITPVPCWTNSSVMLASSGLSKAIYFPSESPPPPLPSPPPPPPQHRPTYSWQGSIVLDPGVEVFSSFLVEQAQRHFEFLGNAFQGIAIDRCVYAVEHGVFACTCSIVLALVLVCGLHRRSFEVIFAGNLYIAPTTPPSTATETTKPPGAANRARPCCCLGWQQQPMFRT